MQGLPKTIGVLTFNPKTSKEILSILKEYFKCIPYMSYTLNDSLYILPNTKTLNVIINNIYDYFEDYLDIDILRGAIYKYNPAPHTYNISKNSYYSNILPHYIRVSGLNTEKLKSFLED